MQRRRVKHRWRESYRPNRSLSARVIVSDGPCRHASKKNSQATASAGDIDTKALAGVEPGGLGSAGGGALALEPKMRSAVRRCARLNKITFSNLSVN